MIPVSVDVQQKFLENSVDKQVILKFLNNDFSKINWYAGTLSIPYETTWTNEAIKVGTGYDNYNQLWDVENGWTVVNDYIKKVAYISVDLEIAILNMQADQLPARCRFGIQYYAGNDIYWRYSVNYTTANLLRASAADEKARIRIIRPVVVDDTNSILKINKILFGFRPDDNFPEGEDVTVAEMRFGGIQYDLSDNRDELPYPKNYNHYIEDGTYLDYVVDEGPQIDDITNEDIQLERLSLTESLCSQDNLKFGCCEAAHFEIGIVNHHDKFFNRTIIPYIACYKRTDPEWTSDCEVPLGVFKIKEVKQEYTYDFDKKNLTCYDSIMDLDADVGDWLTKYMWVTDSGNKGSSYGPSFSRVGVEYARQLFATFINLMKRLNFIKDYDFHSSLLYDISLSNLQSYNYDYIWYDTPVYGSYVICIQRVNELNWGSSNPAPECMRVVLHSKDGKTDEELKTLYSSWDIKTDDNLHGFPSCASIFIKITYSDNHVYGILADSGDYIYVGPDVIKTDIWAVCDIGRLTSSETATSVVTGGCGLADKCKIYEVTIPEFLTGLVNAGTRLVYYNYGTQQLANFNSSCTGRDAIRSLLEVNGCFFHMNRYGKPEILYASKAGLYPSNILYPSDDLYPSNLPLPLMSMSRYMSFEKADYEVHNYGKIQIKTKGEMNGSQAKSICSYEYIGDEDEKNTYIIEDNIFYCAEGTVYEYGSQIEVDEMLRNMYNIIRNMKYTPHTTKAIGQPYAECGDRLRLLTKTGGIESFIFRRTLKGIHGLKDTYEAVGDEYNEELNTFDYVPYSPPSS